MATKTVLVFLVASWLCVASALIDCHDPDCEKPTQDLVADLGYPAEVHEVTTEDGYILTVHRIARPGSPVVFLQHGLEDASHTWVMNFAAGSLGFLLYDAGFDVWMGNSRGNTYSLKHTTLNPQKSPFWKFSFDEMGKYDFPAQITYALNATSKEKLVYVGHSQGTLQAFISLNNNEEIASKVSLFVALAPVAHIGNLTSPLMKVLADLHLDAFLKFFGFNRFTPHSTLLDFLLSGICKETPVVCTSTLCALMGCDYKDWNVTRYDVYLTHDPAGTSVQNMVHYAQGFRSGTYGAYDYGSEKENKAHYGTSTPPMYGFENFKTPIALFSGGQDDLADPKDVQILLSRLPKETIVFQNYLPNYSHLDFVWGLNAPKLVYEDVIKLAKQYQS